MADKTKISLVKKEQKLAAIIIAGIVVVGLFGIYYLTTESANTEKNVNNNKKINYVSPLDQIDTQSVVLERTQKQLRDTEKKTENLQQKVDSMLNAKPSVDKDAQTITENLKKRVDELEQKLKTVTQHETAGLPNENQGNLLPEALPNLSQNVNDTGKSMIREDRLALLPIENEMSNREPLKNPNTYVPSGTFVKAVVIGGADASASVTAQANPKVMLLRLIENGTLPNHQKSHLKDCMAVGRVTGDISSERGSISIERLSCVFANNEVVDQKVEAIVFGPDGKVDVRGNLHEGGQQYVGRAFAAGTLSGLSDGLSQTYTTNSISAEGNVQTINPGRIFQYGAAKGAGKAMDKLADYQMRKAEQFHPVIQLSAGTIVDIVFQMGFFLDGKNHEDTDKKSVGNYSLDATTNTPTLFPPPSTNQDLQTLPLSQQAVERIEKYHKELGLRVSRTS